MNGWMLPGCHGLAASSWRPIFDLMAPWGYLAPQLLKWTSSGWWLGHPSEKIWKSVGMISNPIYGKIKNGNPTTNQSCVFNSLRRSIGPSPRTGKVRFWQWLLVDVHPASIAWSMICRHPASLRVRDSKHNGCRNPYEHWWPFLDLGQSNPTLDYGIMAQGKITQQVMTYDETHDRPSNV